MSWDGWSSLFVKPMSITGVGGRLALLIPLSLSISIVWKTIRCERLSAIPLASVRHCFMIVMVMMLIGAALYGIFRLLA